MQPAERTRRAAIVSPNPSSRAGGVEWVCVLLAGVLEREGWQVSIVGPSREPHKWQSRLGSAYLALSWASTEAVRRAPQLDLIVSNGFLGIGCPRGIPRIHLFHGTMVSDTTAQADTIRGHERLRRSLGAGVAEALAGRACARVVCVSDAVAEEVQRYYRLRTDAVIPNGIDTHIFAPREMQGARRRMGLPAYARYALFVGRTESRKGSDLLVEAARRGGYELLIAGAPGGLPATHLGILAPDELADAYAASDCVLFPSRYEACSLVVLEALACGRPLLSTRVGWMKSFLRAVPSYEALCVQAEVEDIAARLKALAEIETGPLVSAARAFVLENNSLERWSQLWMDLVEELQPSAL